jgi:signal transduction histidine kinase
VSIQEVRTEVQLLAGVLLDDVDRIAQRVAARIRELSPSVTRVPRRELALLVANDTRKILQGIRDLQSDSGRGREPSRTSGAGMSVDDMLKARRIGLEVVREEAQAIAQERDIGTDALLEFVDATVRLGEPGTPASASAHHEAELLELGRLAREQAALRRVATILGGEFSPEEVFTKVAEEVALVLDAETAAIDRYEPDGYCTSVGSWGAYREVFEAGSRWELECDSVSASVYRTGQPTRIEKVEQASGPIAAAMRQARLRSAVASPIIVDGRLWGVIVVATRRRTPMPADTEARITQFTELVATAIANVQARSEAQRLAEEQAALRRVATIVARESSPAAVLAKVAEEVGLLLGVEAAVIHRYEPEGEATVVASWGKLGTAAFCTGHQWKPNPGGIVETVRRTRRPARLDIGEAASGAIAEAARKVGVRSAVGSPIVVNDRLWGVIAAGTGRAEPMPADAELRIAEFTELVATAVANLQARGEVKRLADEQAALRRVATLVAREASPEEVFSKVAEEVVALLGAESGAIDRFEPDGCMTIVGSWGKLRDAFEVGTRWKLEGNSASVSVYRTGRPVRLETYEQVSGPISRRARGVGLHAAVGAPIVVDGGLWGALVAATSRADPLPGDGEARIAQFAELVAAAIANVQARSDLAASRARIVAAADEERRRLVRDLHDGAQQRLVHTLVTLKLARRVLERDRGEAAELLAEALQHAQTATDELRELSHGILPAVLTHGGLVAGVRALASRMSIPVGVDIAGARLPGTVEATAYFIVAEALTNVAKHSRARSATVTARVDGQMLAVEVCDDGIGGAQADGPGLVGLRDRIATVEGLLRIESPAGGGTLIAAFIPIRQWSLK